MHHPLDFAATHWGESDHVAKACILDNARASWRRDDLVIQVNVVEDRGRRRRIAGISIWGIQLLRVFLRLERREENLSVT